MELRHLRYFVAVAEELHFSRAAAKLRIATPTLSAQIQVLETLLGARLFTRKTRSVVLTSVGKRFLEEAQAVIRRAERRVVTLKRSGSVSGEHLLPYLNRLADLVWVLARAAEQAEARPSTPAYPERGRRSS